MTSRQCAHEACGCEMEATGSKYCSAQCEKSASQSRTDVCECGHASCDGEALRIGEEIAEGI
jgi:hypothetical protein